LISVIFLIQVKSLSRQKLYFDSAQDDVTLSGVEVLSTLKFLKRQLKETIVSLCQVSLFLWYIIENIRKISRFVDPVSLNVPYQNFLYDTTAKIMPVWETNPT
jgi:hypothetical protein